MLRTLVGRVARSPFVAVAARVQPGLGRARPVSVRHVSLTAPKLGRKDGNTQRLSRSARKTQTRKFLQRRAEFRNRHARPKRSHAPHGSHAPRGRGRGSSGFTGESSLVLPDAGDDHASIDEFLKHLSAPERAGGREEDTKKLLEMDTDARIVEMSTDPDLLKAKHFNQLIRAQAVQGQHDAALRSYQRMMALGVTPNTRTFRAIMYSCALSANVPVAQSVVAQIATFGAPVHPSLYASLAQAYVNAGQLDDAFGVIKLAETNAEALRKDAGYVVSKLEGHGAVNLDPSIFTVLIKGCVDRREYRRAWACFDRMRIHYTDPDTPSLSLMIHVCARTGDAERAMDLWNEFPLLNIEPSFLSYSAIIHACARTWRYAPRAFDFYFQLRAAGYTPDTQIMNTLMHSCSHSGDVPRAHMIFNTMKASSGLQPTAVTYATYLNVIARAQNVRQPSPTLARELEAMEKSPLSSEQDGNPGIIDEREVYDDSDWFAKADDDEDPFDVNDHLDWDASLLPDADDVTVESAGVNQEEGAAPASTESGDSEYERAEYEASSDTLETYLQAGTEEEPAPAADAAVTADIDRVDDTDVSAEGGHSQPMTLSLPKIGPATIKNLNVQLAWRVFQEYVNAGQTPTSVRLSFRLGAAANSDHTSSLHVSFCHNRAF